ncbi:MAG: NAD(P)/FAD-dependent oxidoreductase [Bacteroidota bacterium]
MDRKEFLKTSLTLGIGLPFLSVLLESCDSSVIEPLDIAPNFQGKVLIIGAGSAGMTAAYLLKQQNIDFEILEAASDFGGRMKRISDFADFPIDLGAEWIHTDPKILGEMLNDTSHQGKVETIVYNPKSVYNWNRDKLRKKNWSSAFYSEHKFKSTTWYGFFDTFVVPEIRDRMRLNTPVTAIDYSGEKIQVTTSQNELIEADKVIVTIPVKMLQLDSIAFTPALPQAKKEAIESIDMEYGIKVFIEFEEKFFPDMTLIGPFLQALGDNGRLYYDAAFRKDSEKNIMGLFAVGEGAEAFATMDSDQEVIDTILAQLDEVFDGKASEHYVKHITQNWSQEPYIQGSYALYFEGNRSEIQENLLSTLDEKIYFAGEAMSNYNQSTVHGAAETAYWAVQKIFEGQ